MQQRTETLGDVRAAEEVGASEHPRASLHLKMANDRIAYAEKLIRNGQHKKAALELEEAEADAELAIALVKEQQMEDKARQALREVHDLRQDIGVQPEREQVVKESR